MRIILDGIYLGLTLSILLGPIFIILLQTSIEHGSRAGLKVAGGIWISDVLISMLALVFVSKIRHLVENPDFIFWMGMVGGAILIGVGLYTYFKKNTLELDKKRKHKTSGWGRHILKGFLVNTINPFTFLFWLTSITSYVTAKRIGPTESYIFVGTIIAVIIITDSAKVVLAKTIRSKINPNSLNTVNRIAGSALIIFGFILLIRSAFYG